MRENQSVEDDEKKLFAFLEYSWTPEYELFDFFQFSKEYRLQNRHDIGSFRKSIIQELNKNEKNAIFIADYKEIEKKINENPNYKRLKEFYIGLYNSTLSKAKKTEDIRNY